MSVAQGVLVVLGALCLVGAGICALTGWPLGGDDREDNAAPILLFFLAVVRMYGAAWTPPVVP